MNKYYLLLKNILEFGELQLNKKGDNIGLLNQRLAMSPSDIELILKEHPIAKKLLRAELNLYMDGVTDVASYNDIGIHWWDYCAPTMVNTYPTYFRRLEALLTKINNEKRSSKNYVLFIGETGVETSQLPCLSLIQFQLWKEELHMTVYQRSADSNLGLPSDIYQTRLIADMIDVPLGSITFFIGNAHIYSNNIKATYQVLKGEKVKFNLNT